MIETRRLTIIPIDKTVYTDLGAIHELDLSSCGIPENIHVLQWNNPVWKTASVKAAIEQLPYGEGSGWIEYASNDPNQDITELPNWAILCYNKWKEQYDIISQQEQEEQ